MGLSSGTLTIMGLGFQAFGFLQQQDAADEKRKAEQEQAAAARERAVAERRQADLTRLNQVRRQIREKRTLMGTLINTGAQRAPGSSSVVAGAGAVQTQFATNMGFNSEMGGLNENIYSASARYGEAGVTGAMAAADYQQAGAIGGLGKTIFDMGGGYKTAFGGSGGTSESDGSWIRAREPQAGEVPAIG